MAISTMFDQFPSGSPCMPRAGERTLKLLRYNLVPFEKFRGDVAPNLRGAVIGDVGGGDSFMFRRVVQSPR